MFHATPDAGPLRTHQAMMPNQVSQDYQVVAAQDCHCQVAQDSTHSSQEIPQWSSQTQLSRRGCCNCQCEYYLDFPSFSRCIFWMNKKISSKVIVINSLLVFETMHLEVFYHDLSLYSVSTTDTYDLRLGKIPLDN